jgi:hypothetical protein
MKPNMFSGRSIAVFTSGGDSQGMNSAVRAVVRLDSTIFEENLVYKNQQKQRCKPHKRYKRQKRQKRQKRYKQHKQHKRYKQYKRYKRYKRYKLQTILTTQMIKRQLVHQRHKRRKERTYGVKKAFSRQGNLSVEKLIIITVEPNYRND